MKEDKTMKAIYIEAKREGYSPEQCPKTMTVGELISFLSDYDEDTKIYLSHDRGYTYGSVTKWRINDEEYYNDDDEYEEEI